MEYLKLHQVKKRKTQQKIPMRRKTNIKSILNFPQHVKDSMKLRDGRCVLCKSVKNKLSAHHFIYKSAFGMGIIENGVSLCIECHDDIHNHDPNYGLRDYVQQYLDTLYPEFDNNMRKLKKYGGRK